MSKTNWNWDPIPRVVRRHSTVRTVTTTTQMSTGVEDVNQPMDNLFAQLKATSDLYRQRKRSLQSTFKPIEWSFKDMEISVSSEEDSNDQMSVNRVMTSTPQTNKKLAITSAQTLTPFKTPFKSPKTKTSVKSKNYLLI